MYRTVVTICTTSLTFGNSTFCSHSVFMCFVWIWEQTASISLCNINWLVCITETVCVYCAVRTVYVRFWQAVCIARSAATLLAVTMRGCRRNGPNYHTMPTFPNSQGVLYKVKRSALNGDHVHPSACGLVSATKPLVGFLWNSLEFPESRLCGSYTFLTFVINLCPFFFFHISRPIWAKFGVRDPHIMLPTVLTLVTSGLGKAVRLLGRKRTYFNCALWNHVTWWM